MQSAIEKFKTNYRLQRRIIVVLFTIVPVALLLVFSYLPLVKMIQYSFTDWDGDCVCFWYTAIVLCLRI